MHRENRDQVLTPPWHFADAAIALFLGFILTPLLASSLLQVFFPGMAPDYQFFWVQWSPLISWVLFFLVLKKRYRCLLKPFLGLQAQYSWWITFLQGILASLSLILLVEGLSLAMSFFHVEIKEPYSVMPAQQLKIIAFFAVLKAPFLEEVVFRGFLQSTLYRYFPPGWSIFLSSILFTLFHTAYQEIPAAQLYVFFMGLLFGWFRYRAGSVYPGMIAHGINNMLAACSFFMT